MFFKIILNPLKINCFKFKQHENQMMEKQKSTLEKILLPFQFISIRQKLCFPNKKIAIYESGKLFMMMELLKKLKNDSHKVIIFTHVLIYFFILFYLKQ